MKLLFGLLSLGFFLFLMECSSANYKMKERPLLKMLYKTKFDTARHNYGQHISINLFFAEVGKFYYEDDSRNFSYRYPKTYKLRILEEFLTFEGDTSVSNMQYYFKAGNYSRPKDRQGFTVQIEALYSFTRMFTQEDYPYQPTLIKRDTGEPLNNNPKQLSEIYLIYKKWLKRNSKSNFKKAKLPLNGTPYCWLGEDTTLSDYIDKKWIEH